MNDIEISYAEPKDFTSIGHFENFTKYLLISLQSTKTSIQSIIYILL